MKKIVSALAVALLVGSVASAANLMIDEKSKTYDYNTAVDEINSSITAVGSAETETAKITINANKTVEIRRFLSCIVYLILIIVAPNPQ